MLSEETKALWRTVKGHLSQQGLAEVKARYPELRGEIDRLSETKSAQADHKAAWDILDREYYRNIEFCKDFYG